MAARSRSRLPGDAHQWLTHPAKASDWIDAVPSGRARARAGIMTFPTLRTEALRAGLLRPEHAEDAVRLSAAAGWNQTVDDWRVMIRHGQGWGRFTQAGQLVSTTLLLPYDQRVGWLAMVLVAERHPTRASPRRC
jgi:hypothetical protein